MSRIDLRRRLKELYRASTDQVDIVDVPELGFITIEGQGDYRDTDEAFTQASETLFNVAFALKFLLRTLNPPVEFSVMPLESLWWPASSESSREKKSEEIWKWKLMILQSDIVIPGMFDDAVISVKKKKDPPMLSEVRLEKFHEGLSAQTLHRGQIVEGDDSVDLVYSYIAGHGYEPRGKYHEIYLTDFRNTPPEDLRTIIRRPVKTGGAVSYYDNGNRSEE